MATYSQLAYMANQETARHNLATEAVSEANLKELQRSNLAREGETHRSNIEHEYVNAYNAQTTRMSHAEQARHNRSSENIDRTKAAAAQTSAQASMSNAVTSALRQQEEGRHNVATEAENRRHNKNTELNDYIGTGVNAAVNVSKEARSWAKYAKTGGAARD